MHRDEDNDPATRNLVRYWFEFELSRHQPEPPPPGTVQLDGEPPMYRLVARGIGVTGYDRSDCLDLIQELSREPLPAVTKEVRNVDIESLNIGFVGNPVWRGIW